MSSSRCAARSSADRRARTAAGSAIRVAAFASTLVAGVLPVRLDAAQGPARGAEGLCLELARESTSPRLGEPVLVAVALRNCSTATLQVEDLLAPEYGFLELSLVGPGGAPRAVRPVARRDARGKRPRPLAPGAYLHAWVPVYAGADGWLLDRPGRYELRAAYATGASSLAAAPLRFEVTPARNDREAAAARLIMTPEAARFLLAGHDDGRRAEARLSALTREQPESALAPYARLALALARASERFDPAQKAFRPADCAGAVELLAPAVERIGDPFLATRGALVLSDCLRRLGRPAEADRVVAALRGGRRMALELPGVRDALDAYASRAH